jgi:hypothetical protein
MSYKSKSIEVPKELFAMSECKLFSIVLLSFIEIIFTNVNVRLITCSK